MRASNNFAALPVFVGKGRANPAAVAAAGAAGAEAGGTGRGGTRGGEKVASFVEVSVELVETGAGEMQPAGTIGQTIDCGCQFFQTQQAGIELLGRLQRVGHDMGAIARAWRRGDAVHGVRPAVLAETQRLVPASAF